MFSFLKKKKKTQSLDVPLPPKGFESQQGFSLNSQTPQKVESLNDLNALQPPQASQQTSQAQAPQASIESVQSFDQGLVESKGLNQTEQSEKSGKQDQEDQELEGLNIFGEELAKDVPSAGEVASSSGSSIESFDKGLSLDQEKQLQAQPSVSTGSGLKSLEEEMGLQPSKGLKPEGVETVSSEQGGQGQEQQVQEGQEQSQGQVQAQQGAKEQQVSETSSETGSVKPGFDKGLQVESEQVKQGEKLGGDVKTGDVKPVEAGVATDDTSGLSIGKLEGTVSVGQDVELPDIDEHFDELILGSEAGTGKSSLFINQEVFVNFVQGLKSLKKELSQLNANLEGVVLNIEGQDLKLKKIVKLMRTASEKLIVIDSTMFET